MRNKNIVFSVVGLALIVLIFGFFNRENVKDKAEIHEKREIIIKSEEGEYKFNLDEISELGEEEFTADLKSSGKAAETNIYTGVPVKNIFGEKDMEIKRDLQIIVTSVDGYVVALESDEILEEDNVYLAYKENGELLKTREDGGSGPYQLIIREDQFSQRWCKHVVEILLDE